MTTQSRCVPMAIAGLLSAIFMGATAHADIAPIPKPGTKFVDFTVELTGLDAHADYVVVAWDPPYKDQIEHHATFTPTDASIVIASGRGRGNLGGPHLYLMPKAAFDAWQATTRTLVDAQRSACFERGEGCAHPSRFVAHYPPPPAKDIADCGVKVDVVTSVPSDGPDHLVRRWQLVEAGARVCRLTELAATPAPAPTPTPAPTPASAPTSGPATTPTQATTLPASTTTTRSGGCNGASTCTVTLPWVLAAACLRAGGRRRAWRGSGLLWRRSEPGAD